MMYIFTEFWANEFAIFDDKEKMQRFVNDFRNKCVKEVSMWPQEGKDYIVYKTTLFNPDLETWWDSTEDTLC